ncbi:SPERT protein, partial [Upupa epops]|nr:SPERT protein [Upupa epops]
AMSAFDLTTMSMQCTEPEVDCRVPRLKLRDEVFVFIDNNCVNETYCQPPHASHQKLRGKRAQSEWTIWEENRALWEENRALRIENRILWEENKALQRLQSQNEAVQVIDTDAIQQSQQKENKPFPSFQEQNRGFQGSPGSKALQVVEKKHRTLEDFQQENKAIPTIWKDRKAITVHEESKGVSSDLSKDADTIAAVEEVNPGSASEHEHEAPTSTTPTPTQGKTESAPRMQGEHEILQALQDLYEFLHAFLKANNLLGEKQGCHVLCDVNRSFQEEYSELRLQLSAVKNTVSDITAQIAVLEKEITDITSLTHGEAGEKMVTEHPLGEM